MEISEQLATYLPFNEQEAADRSVMLTALARYRDGFERANLVLHWTGSAWITNRTRDKVLMVYHNIYDSWSWTGGHADGESRLDLVALREAKEETGLQSIRPLSDELFSIETLTVNSHRKNGIYVPSHLHLNATYLLEADEDEPLHGKADENSAVKWFPLDEAVEACSEPWMRPIYQKLNDKLRAFRER